MSYLQKIKEHNRKQKEAATKFLVDKGYDLSNLPKVEHKYPPILQQRPNPNHILTIPEEDDSDSTIMLNYLQEKQKRGQTANFISERGERKMLKNEINQQDASSLNSSFFDLAKYEYRKQEKQSMPQEKVQKKEEKVRVLEKAPPRLKQQAYAQNYIVITEDYKKSKVKIEDILMKRQPMRINYKKANNAEWQNHKKNEDYRLQYALHKFTKIKEFKNNQKAIIKCGLQNNNVFVCMPTGGGKSLTFQILTFLIKGIYLCVLPLISLIFDQEMQAKKMGIQAYSMTSNTPPGDIRQIYQKLSNFKQSENSIVIFCTPEKLNLSQQFSDILETIYRRNQLKRIIIDEVHCVSTWGKDFRIQYQNLSGLKKRFPNTPILALTATVTEVVKQDIITRLGIQGCFFFQSSFNRPNLYYEVRQKDKNILEEIQQIIQRYKNKAGLIYCLSKKDCQELCVKLNKKGYRTAFYHADIDEQQKKTIQQKWMDNKINIIIATIAFGMGINKPDVRFVVHHTMSKSLENYYQESGRAGRDAAFSECILFYRKQDKQFLQSMNLKNDYSTLDRKEFSTKQLAEMIKYCEDKSTCRRQFQLHYLGETDFDPQLCDKTCDNCKSAHVYVQYQCVTEGKALIRALVQLENGRVNLSRNQLIDLIKGKGDKSLKYKMSQIERIGLSLSDLKYAFQSWKQNQIQSLIVDFMSYQILTEKVVKNLIVRNKKESEVVNVYIKCDIPKCKAFLSRVETLPFRRNLPKNRHPKDNNIYSSLQENSEGEEIQNTEAVCQSEQLLQPQHQNQCSQGQAEKYQKYKRLLQEIFEQDSVLDN